jgi:preprotein translocase subunit SecG
MKGMILLSLVLTILQLIACVVLIAVVLLQSGKTAGLSGVIGGGAETFLSKNKAKTLDAKLARWTKWFAIAFVVLTLALNIFGV